MVRKAFLMLSKIFCLKYVLDVLLNMLLFSINSPAGEKLGCSPGWIPISLDGKNVMKCIFVFGKNYSNPGKEDFRETNTLTDSNQEPLYKLTPYEGEEFCMSILKNANLLSIHSQKERVISFFLRLIHYFEIFQQKYLLN